MQTLRVLTNMDSDFIMLKHIKCLTIFLENVVLNILVCISCIPIYPLCELKHIRPDILCISVR